MNRPHIALDDLAILAEGRTPAAEAEIIAEHLAECRSCMAAYADAVRYRAAWIAAPHAFEPTPELFEAGLSVGGVPRAERSGASRESRTHRVAHGRMIAAVAAAVLIGIFVVGDMARRAWRSQIPAPIVAALEASSSVGLVLPGGERGAASTRPTYRGGTKLRDAELEGTVEDCLRAYESGRRGAAETYAVAAGCLVTGQITDARDYVEDGLHRYPNDFRLLVLSADIAYRESDLELAERRLREALRQRRGDPTATLDLAIVLAANGQPVEAKRWLDALVVSQAHTPIGERARRLLAASLR